MNITWLLCTLENRKCVNVIIIELYVDIPFRAGVK